MPSKNLLRKVETVAEKAGLPSVEEKVKEIESVQGVEKRERKKRVISEEQREALRQRLVKAREVRAQKRLAIKRE